MTPEQYEQLVKKAQEVGIMMSPPEITEERKEEVRRYIQENPPVDYLSLMQ